MDLHVFSIPMQSIFKSQGASQVEQWERAHLPMLETTVQSLGQEDPLEKEMVTHSSVLAWEIPWTERSLAGCSPCSRKESDRAVEPDCKEGVWGCRVGNHLVRGPLTG